LAWRLVPDAIRRVGVFDPDKVRRFLAKLGGQARCDDGGSAGPSSSGLASPMRSSARAAACSQRRSPQPQLDPRLSPFQKRRVRHDPAAVCDGGIGPRRRKRRPGYPVGEDGFARL